MKFVIYNDEGRILRRGDAPEDMLDLQVQPGEYMLRGVDTAVIGEYVNTGTKQIRSMGPRPSERHEFDYARKEWRDPRTLVQAKLEKVEAIKAECRVREQADLVFDGKVFNADDYTRNLMFQKMVLAREAELAGQPYAVDWPLDDGSNVTLNAEQLKAVLVAIDAQIESVRGMFRMMRARVMASRNLDDVRDVSWE